MILRLFIGENDIFRNKFPIKLRSTFQRFLVHPQKFMY